MIDRPSHWKQKLYTANEVFAWLYISLRQLFTELKKKKTYCMAIETKKKLKIKVFEKHKQKDK